MVNDFDWLARLSFGKLSAEQVAAYALEQVGKGTPEQDEIAALLANSDPTEWQTIDRYLEKLAQTENRDRTQGLRKWRLAELKHLIKCYRDMDETSESPEEDEMFGFLYVFLDFWRDYNELADSEAVQPAWGQSLAEMLAEHQAWAEREEASLRDDQNKRTVLWNFMVPDAKP